MFFLTFLISPSTILTAFTIFSFCLLFYALWPKKGQTVVEKFVQIVYGIAKRSFFKEVSIPNKNRIPLDEPVLLVCAPHSNQFVDAIILSHCLNRKVHFMMAASSLKIPVIGKFSQLMNAVITVERPDDHATVIKGKVTIEGTKVTGIDTEFTKIFEPKTQILINKKKGFVIEVNSDTELTLSSDFPMVISTPTEAKCIPHLNQKDLYNNCWNAFNDNACLSIFPEGGSHDRSTFLPFKSGAAQLALGFTATYPEKRVNIIPVGMNYYQGHKFRRACAFIDIGEPIRYSVDQVLAYKKGGDERKHVVNDLMDKISQALYNVTTTADDWETLERVNVVRRLMTNQNVHLNTEEKTKVTRHLIEGYKKFKDEDDIQKLVIRIDDYKFMLSYLGLTDAYLVRQSKETSRSHSLNKFFYHFFLAIYYIVLCFPGMILGWPVMLWSKIYSILMQSKALKKSSVKIEATDVVASNKLVGAFQVCLFLLFAEPYIIEYILNNYFGYTLGINDYFKIMSIIPWLLYFGITRSADDMLHHISSARFLLKRIITKHDDRIIQRREDLRAEIDKIVETRGPQLFGSEDEFQKKRVLVNGYTSITRVKSYIQFSPSTFAELDEEMDL
ncbi:hypothetical protein WA158_004305 [Blastocystis sp. Blastoise]